MIRISDGSKRGRPSVASVIWTLLCLVLFLIAGYAGIFAGAVPKPAPMVHYTVGADDTVWSISLRIAKADDANPEAVEDDILRINGLNDGQVWPGMDLLVPADRQ